MSMQACFECTDWSVFRDAATKGHTTDIEEYADVVSGYILKCMDDVCVTKNITVQANQKPWMTTEVQVLLKARISAFKSGDVTALRSARANLNKAIRLAKRAHGQKNPGSL